MSCFSNVNLWLYQNRTPPWIFFEECSYLFHDLYLLSEPRNNHCFERAAQGQLSKCKRRNNYNFLIKSSWLTQNEKELNNVGDTELRLQKQWKSKTSNMLQVSRNVIITSKTWGPGAWDEGQGPNNRTLALLCRTALIISHAVKKSVKPHEIGYVYV